jgi:hypothetical protein
MLIYADGSALSRSLTSGSESASWMRWSSEHSSMLVTSPLGVSELRSLAAPLGFIAREKAHAIATSLAVVRFSDQALEHAAQVASEGRGLPPFTALHLGFALAHPEVEQVATYDPVLARAASLYALEVVSPGRPAMWWGP